MSTAILYYSFSGKTKAFAEKTAAETGAELFEICPLKKYSKFAAYFLGCFGAIKLKSLAIEPLGADLAIFDEIVIMGPIWAGHPAPPVNGAIDLLPAGKSVSLICVSDQGGYELTKTAALITAKNCTIKETRCLSKTDL